MSVADLARSLLDTPRWVETREMLLAGRARIFGLAPDRRRFVAVSLATPALVAVVGRPEAEFIQGAVSAAHERMSASTYERIEVLCAEEDGDHVAAALPGWNREGADVHEWPGALPLPGAQQDARVLTRDEVPALDIPPELKDEILDGSEGWPIVAALELDRPVAFSYPTSVTETLWDVSIDTLEGFRRRGHAARAFRHLAHLMGRHHKWPVWGSLDGNEPSRLLALKLGFVPAERLALFTAPS